MLQCKVALLVNIAHSRKFYEPTLERDERPPDGLSLLNLRSKFGLHPKGRVDVGCPKRATA